MVTRKVGSLLSLMILVSIVLAACAPASAPAPAAETVNQSEVIQTESPATEVVPSGVTETMAPSEPLATEASGSPAEESTLVYIENSTFYPLDPFIISWHALPQYATYATLIKLAPDQTRYVGYLADRWEVSEDQTQITMHIREGMTFQDGTPINAEAIKFTYDRHMDPEVASPQGGSVRANFESVEVLDEFTLLFTMKFPYAPFYSVIEYIEIVSPTAYEKAGPDA